ncbi:nuclear hormone receptor HR96-like [Oppia nitens]|uniref:nuclear hormone receptor HR96-like n=1 Tax=Oppia nitens TaxID=1686743 RepID=UPI0023DBC580|nr:nuclear hormone receptor HR96-like [Oppia nitens]
MNDKKCCVCGDRAVGNNFNALTCESCRSFFRRNAFRVEEFHCFFDNNCSINWLTRKFCKTCRLKKCFAVGMKKNIVDTTVSNERQKVSDIPTLIRELIFSFNELEMNRFRELFSSAVMLRDPVLKTISETNTYMDSFTVLQKRAALKCNRIIKMSTNISEFTNLCEEDKIALLKTGCPEVICLLTVVNFDFNDNYWTVPVVNIN